MDYEHPYEFVHQLRKGDFIYEYGWYIVEAQLLEDPVFYEDDGLVFEFNAMTFKGECHYLGRFNQTSYGPKIARQPWLYNQDVYYVDGTIKKAGT